MEMFFNASANRFQMQYGDSGDSPARLSNRLGSFASNAISTVAIASEDTYYTRLSTFNLVQYNSDSLKDLTINKMVINEFIL